MHKIAKVIQFNVGMARGIPRPLMSRNFFDSSIPRGIDFITPRLLESLPKFAEDLENTEFPFWVLKYEKKEKISENFQKFVKIFQFLFLFFRITNQFLVSLLNILNFKI